LDLNYSRLLDFCDGLVVDAVVGSVSEKVFVALLDHRHQDHKNLKKMTYLSFFPNEPFNKLQKQQILKYVIILGHCSLKKRK
jgi:hypothetical protein